MDIILINNCLKILGIHLGIIYTYFKITNHNNFSILKIAYTILIGIILYLFQFFTQNYFSTIIQTIIISCIYSFAYSKITKIKWTYSLIIVIIATSISHIFLSFSAFITMFIITFFTKLNYTNPIITFIIIGIDLLFIINLFKTRRLKNGIPFLVHKNDNDYLDIFILTINTAIIFV